jgi:ABC-type sugar transport system permease subunit
LLDYDYWNTHLCSNEDLHKSARGLSLSYAWLVCHKSDLVIAQEIGLLSRDIAQSNWTEFLDIFLDNINLDTLSDVGKRYKYGELRLSRLNTIYRLIPPAYSLRNLIRGYRAGSTWYNAFFGRHFKWTLAVLAVLAVLSVLLSALQVGLEISVLQNNHDFQRASYGLTVAALVAVAASVATVLVVWLVLFWYHLLSCWWYDRKIHTGDVQI